VADGLDSHDLLLGQGVLSKAAHRPRLSALAPVTADGHRINQIPAVRQRHLDERPGSPLPASRDACLARHHGGAAPAASSGGADDRRADHVLPGLSEEIEGIPQAADRGCPTAADPRLADGQVAGGLVNEYDNNRVSPLSPHLSLDTYVTDGGVFSRPGGAGISAT